MQLSGKALCVRYIVAERHNDSGFTRIQCLCITGIVSIIRKGDFRICQPLRKREAQIVGDLCFSADRLCDSFSAFAVLFCLLYRILLFEGENNIKAQCHGRSIVVLSEIIDLNDLILFRILRCFTLDC